MNVLTMAGEFFYKVAAIFGRSRSAVHRHQKHFADRILLDREGAKRLMDRMQAEADEYGFPIGDWWRHLYHIEYLDPYVNEAGERCMSQGAGILAVAGIEPYCCQLAEGLLKDMEKSK